MIKRRYGHPICKLSHHNAKFMDWVQRRAVPQPCVSVSATHKSVSPPQVTSPALPDTRAQIMAGIDLVHKLAEPKLYKNMNDYIKISTHESKHK